MPTVRVHHADGLWLADLARLAASARNAGYSPVVKGGAAANFNAAPRLYPASQLAHHTMLPVSLIKFCFLNPSTDTNRDF